MHAKIIPTGRARCAASHHDSGDRASKDIHKRQASGDFLDRLAKLVPETQTACYTNAGFAA